MKIFYSTVFVFSLSESAKGSDSEDDFLRQKSKTKLASDSDSDSDIGTNKGEKMTPSNRISNSGSYLVAPADSSTIFFNSKGSSRRPVWRS